MIVTFITSEGTKITVGAFTSIKAALRWTEETVIEIVFSEPYIKWQTKGENDRENVARIKWINECFNQIGEPCELKNKI